MNIEEGSPDRVIKADAATSADEQVLSAVPAKKMVLACVLAYCVPGTGHFVLGRWQRGLTFTLAIFAMFALGLAMQGHMYYPTAEDKLSVFPTFANLGIGLAYFVCYLLHAITGLDLGFGAPQAAAATFEYGNTFLWTAGLLNYLVILDAYDIAIGRKR